MNEVMIMYEANHGFIGVAADYKSAIHYLIIQGWVDDYTEMLDGNVYRYVPIIEMIGKDWRTILLNMNEDQFNEIFSETLTILRYPIYKHE